MKRVLYLVLLTLFILNGHLVYANHHKISSQDKFYQEVENIFQKAVDHYKDGRYDIVEWELKNLLDIYPVNHRLTAIYYLLGRSLYRQQKYSEATQMLDKLIEEYPNSSYMDDARFLLAAIAFQQDHYLNAAQDFLTVLESSSDSHLKEKIQSMLLTLLTDYVTLEDVRSFQNQYRSKTSQVYLQFAEGIQQYRKDNYKAAQSILQGFKEQYPENPLTAEIDRYLKSINKTDFAAMKVGVILPLSGYLQEEARSLLQGIRYALEKNLSISDQSLELEVMDSHGDVLSTIDATRKLMEKENMMAIIGEIESDKTAVIGALSSEKNIPVLTPTATETRLTQVNQNLIQMNPDVSVRGEIIAEYAMNNMGLKTFAILAPANKYGKTITDNFVKTVDKMNGSIVAESWYYEGARDLRDQFSAIRKIGMQKMLRDSVLAENPDLNLSEVDSIIVEQKKAEALERDKNEEKITKFADSTATPVTSIDAIFLPIYTEDISYVAPQLALFNIQTQILGGDYWNDEDILDDNHNYISGIVFSSDFYADETNLTYQRFRNRYRMDVGETPGKMAILGYDTMNFLLNHLDKSVRTPEELLRKLSNTHQFKGLLHPYRFDHKNRVNDYLNILQYKDNTIVKLNSE